MTRICYFGIYNPNYARNEVNIRGLRENGIEVIECRTDKTGFKKYPILFKKLWSLRGRYDVLFVAFHGHAVMPVAWIVGKVFHRKKIIFDALISVYDTNIFDRKKHSATSLMALKYWFIDWLSCALADRVLLESASHCEYFQDTFHVSSSKLRTVLLGCSDKVMYPRLQKKDKEGFLVHFHGTYIPLQGIPFIVKAAKLLENEGIVFNIIGRLSTYREAIDLAKDLEIKNINFIDYLPYNKLSDYMAMADVCLGLFGDTDKAKRTAAFKIAEAMAMAKPVITAETPAVKEFLFNRENVLFCKIADEIDLADKIRELKENEGLRAKIAQNGYNTYKERLSPKAIGGALKHIIEKLNQ